MQNSLMAQQKVSEIDRTAALHLKIAQFLTKLFQLLYKSGIFPDGLKSVYMSIRKLHATNQNLTFHKH